MQSLFQLINLIIVKVINLTIQFIASMIIGAVLWILYPMFISIFPMVTKYGYLPESLIYAQAVTFLLILHILMDIIGSNFRHNFNSEEEE